MRSRVQRALVRGVLLAGGLSLAFVVPRAARAAGASGIDWSSVSGKQVVLFFPGQSAWEWVLTKSEHDGADKVRRGKTCYECHKGEEQKLGDKIASGKEPGLQATALPAGRPATIPVEVKFANDGQRLYARFEWPAPPPWHGEKMDPKVQTRVTLMLGDSHERAFTVAGCWAACHNDLIGMPKAKPGTELTKYLGASRTKLTYSGGDEFYKPPKALAELLSSGVFLEYWQARINPGQPAVPVDGYVLKDMHENKTPLVSATAERQGKDWVAVLSRKLVVGQPGHIDLVSGQVYTFGVAIHEDFTDHRFHDVSFERTLVLDHGNADFVAVRK